MIAKDLTIPRRSDFVLEAHFKSGGTGLDVTEWTFWLTAKRKFADADEAALFQKMEHVNFGTSVSFHLDENDTGESGAFYYDLKALSPEGYGAPLMGGRLTVSPAVTLASSYTAPVPTQPGFPG